MQVLIAVLLMVGFGAKVPMWPLHFWLPDAHSKAPTIGSVLLAGVLLKLGTYGLLRFWYSTVPDGALEVAPWLGALGVVGIIYGVAGLPGPDRPQAADRLLQHRPHGLRACSRSRP